MAVRAITIKQGATWRLAFRVRDDGTLRNLTGWTARMQVRRTHANAATLLSLDDTSGGGITIEPLIGKVTLTATPAQTEALPAPLAAVYDIELEGPEGQVDRVLEGVARITPEVTRAEVGSGD
jgi:hypothetical protein